MQLYCKYCTTLLISEQEFVEAEARYSGQGRFYGSESWADAAWEARREHERTCPACYEAHSRALQTN